MLEDVFPKYCEIVKKIAGIRGFRVPKSIAEVMWIFVDKYIEEGVEIELTRKDVENAVKAPKNQVITALEILEELGFLSKDRVMRYNIP